MIEIPYNKLSLKALRGVIEDFILREGTDYGCREYTLEEKVVEVQKQLERGRAKVVFDEKDETCTIISVNR